MGKLKTHLLYNFVGPPNLIHELDKFDLPAKEADVTGHIFSNKLAIMSVLIILTTLFFLSC